MKFQTSLMKFRTSLMKFQTSFDPRAWESVPEPLQPVGEDGLGDRVELHVRRTLVDLADFRVAPELLHRILLRVAVPAEELYGERGHSLRHLRGEELGHGRFAEERPAGVFQAGGVVDQQAGSRQFRRGPGELKVD